MRFRPIQRPPMIAGIICGLAALFYLYEFTLRVSIGVIVHDLMRDLNIHAAVIGTISAFYFYAYAPMQIPAGLLLDRYGPRLLLSVMLVVCALGAVLFSMTHGIWLASAGRFLMGFGSAFAFVGVLLLISRWYPPHYFAVLAGVTQLMGSMGAVSGEIPIAAAVEKSGWRPTMLALGLFGFALAVVLWLVVRDHPKGTRRRHEAMIAKLSTWKCLKKVVKKSQTWWVGLYAFTCWTPITVFASLWGVTALKSWYPISTTVASTLVSMVWFGIATGSPFIGWFSDRIGRRCVLLVLNSLVGIIATLLLLYVNLPMWALHIVLFLFGFAASGQSLTFGLVKENNQQTIVGTAMGFNNMAVIIGAAIFQPLVGYFLILGWDGQTVNHVPIYSGNDFRDAFLVLPCCYTLGLLVSLWKLRETYCKPQYKLH